MNEGFSRTLSLLRQEKGVSQRTAATALGISQALLSHYENGIREPGLPFVVKACDYYGVSADFLLGRTLSRDGTTIAPEELYDLSQEKNNSMKGGVLALLSKKLLVNSIGVLFDLLGKLNNKRAIKAAANYLSVAVYQLYRDLYRVNPTGKGDFFSVPDRQFVSGLPRVDMILSETEYVDALAAAGRESEFPDMSHTVMTETYPGTYQSLLQIIHSCGERMNAQVAQHQDAVK